MSKGSYILVLVESPGKVQKIQGYLGNEYKVMASVGHIIDLDPKKMSIKIENNFEPEYMIMTGKEDVVKNLKSASKKASKILLASDEDREGEMIAWSIAYELGLKNPDRIVFNSITEKELLNAIKAPRKIDMNLVYAQKARRILDRIVGYEISPILWKSMGHSAKSAGRVQSVVVRLIVEKELEISKFFSGDIKSYFKFNGMFIDTKNKQFKAQLYETSESAKKKKIFVDEEENNMEDLDTDAQEINEIMNTKTKTFSKGVVAKIIGEKNAKDVMKDITKSKFLISDIIDKETSRFPGPPFTTSTLTQESARKLGFSVKRTMSAAQKLYELGYITYMRTDSTNLSEDALEGIKKHVIKVFGKDYYRRVEYKAKSKNTQEAHEAVRPVDVSIKDLKPAGKIGMDEIRLYSLIWKRAVASQMVPAKFNVKNIKIMGDKLDDYYFITTIENVIFAGFLLAYDFKNIDENQTDNSDSINTNINIPNKGSEIKINNAIGSQDFDKPPSRFNEASLVNKLDPKNLNIGRPSTYGAIISKIQERNYVRTGDIDGVEKESLTLLWNGGKSKVEETTDKVILGKETNKLIPTDMGKIVTEFLLKHFPEIMDYKFTAQMEEELDSIAEGKINWVKVMDNFYKKFHPIVLNVLRKDLAVLEAYNRNLGVHPKTKKKIIATMGHYGPMLKMCEDDDENDCVYAPIKMPLSIDTVTLKDAIALFEWPKDLGEYKGYPVSLNRGKFGLYIKYRKINVSLNNDEKLKDNENISLADAIRLIDEKESKNLWEGKDTTTKIQYNILRGPYGLYVKMKDTSKKTAKAFNVSLPEDTDLENLTLDKLKVLIQTSKEEKAKKRYQKKEAKDNEKDKKKDNDKGSVGGSVTKRKYVRKTPTKTTRKVSKKTATKTARKKTSKK